MKLSAVIRRAWQVYRANFGDLMKSLLAVMAVGGMALAPLLFAAEQSLAPLAWLSAALWVLLVLPVRQNAACALQDLLAGGCSCSPRLLDMTGYWRKVGRGLRALLWLLPLLAGVALAYVAFTGETDGFTLIRYMSNLGGGDWERGVVIVAALYVLTLAPVFLGAAFHSGTRHAAALGNPKLVKGRRGRLMALWFACLLPLLPVLAVLFISAGSYVINVVKTFFATFTLTLGALPAALPVSLIALLALLVLLAPLRALLPAVLLAAETEKNE